MIYTTTISSIDLCNRLVLFFFVLVLEVLIEQMVVQLIDVGVKTVKALKDLFVYFIDDSFFFGTISHSDQHVSLFH
jgi:hypothetical protein